ncbi:transposase [Candidatus Poribacteria bacterium]|nr:transposase [Candidatus Poribacteria bacterium]
MLPIKGRLARIVIPKVGQVKIRLHRPLPDGKIKTLHIIRKASGWYANITVEIADVVPQVDIQSMVGVDVGLESFLTTSDGEKIENPRHLKASECLLKRVQRCLSKRKKGSRRRGKTKERLAKLHERIVNQRRDFHYKTAYRLYSQYDAVAVEDLRIANLIANHPRFAAQSISDAAWGNFVQALGSKAENAGYHLLFVSPNGTSQRCSGCGEIVKKSLAVRIHRCDSCGLVLDRDHNAAINIKRVASTLREGVAVVNAPERLLQERKNRESRKTLNGGVLQQASSFRAG